MTLPYTFDNTTYYDSEGLKALISRALDESLKLTSASAAVQGAVAVGVDVHGERQKGRSSSPPLLSIRVRYYTPSASGAADKVKVTSSQLRRGKTQVNIGICRKHDLFDTDLEKLANLSGSSPRVPESTLLCIAVELLQYAFAPKFMWALAGAIRGWASGRGFTPMYRGFPKKSAVRFVRARVLKGCEVIIHPRAPKGSGLQIKVTAAETRFLKAARQHASISERRAGLQASLKDALEIEEALCAKLDTARYLFHDLRRQQNNTPTTPEED